MLSMIFEQLFDLKSSTYTYIISSGKGREALIIDPVIDNINQYIKVLENYINEIDMVCIMGVFPGFSGQKFIENTYERCRKVKNMILKSKSNSLIQIDGGVTIKNAKKLVNNGADILVSGSHIFKSDNPKLTIANLKDI